MKDDETIDIHFFLLPDITKNYGRYKIKCTKIKIIKATETKATLWFQPLRLTEHSISGVYFFKCKVGTGLQFLVLEYSVFKGILQSTWDIFDRQPHHETNSYRKYVSYTFQATFRPYLSFQWLHQWNCIFSCLAWVQSYLIYTWISLLQLNFKGFLRHAQQNTTSTCLSPWSYKNDKF